MIRLALITTVMAIAPAVIAAPDPKNKYQELADEMAWDWPKDRASLKYCHEHFKGTFKIEMDASGPEGAQRETLVKFKDPEGKKTFSILAHDKTVFVESNNIIYYTHFSPSSSGCSLIAYDLQASKELWKTNLKGLGPIQHFQYHNAVALDIKEGALRVLGNESSGKYVEFVDMKTGKTVGHRVFKDQK